MSVITVIKKIGEEVVSIVEWPFTHAAMLVDLFKEAGPVKDAIVGLVQRFEAIGADTLTDVADKGLNVDSDLQTFKDIQALFAYYKSTFQPAIASAWKTLQGGASATAVSPTAVSPAPAAATAGTQDVPQTGPGLHTTVAA